MLVVELIIGYPIGLLESCKLITSKNKTRIGRGLLAVQNKDFKKIIEA
jgi:hypothetical protein